MKRKRFVKLLMACGVTRNTANKGAGIVRRSMMNDGIEVRPGCYELAWGALMYHAGQRRQGEVGPAES